MLTVIKHTLIESIHKRIALALMVISVLIFAFTVYFFRFQTQANGKILVFAHGGQVSTPADVFVREIFQSSLMTTGGLWTFLGVFAIAPLLSSYLENGMAGLLFTKALSRWQVFLGRVGGVFAMFLATVALLDGIPAFYFWMRTGISPKNFLVAVSILMGSFLSLTAIMALVAIQRNGPAPGIIAAFLQVTISAALAEREQFFKMFTSKWFQQIMNFSYYILPKNFDLSALARKFLVTGTITNWMPLWSTAIFTVAILGLALWQLQRKSL